MNRLIFFVLLILQQTCSADDLRFFHQETFTSASFAEAINHFIKAGEDAGVKELRELALHDYTNDFNLNARIGFVCRVLFEPRKNEPLWPPGNGWLSDLGSIGLPPGVTSTSWSNISRSWPLYPVALSGSTYFVLSEGYSFQGAGHEKPGQYIDYCRLNGTFRKILLKIPIRQEAIRDAAALKESKAWKSIKWKDSGEGFKYEMSEDSAWDFIKKQAESIPVQ